jgi:4-oxalocrotonate tautomerase
MDTMSRRNALKRGALALGSLAARDVAGLADAAQPSGPRPMGSEDLKETGMPHVIVKMYPGRSEEQKRRLADAIVKDVMAITQSNESSVSVAIEEVSPAEWTEKVYKPDIQSKWDALYKKPGY